MPESPRALLSGIRRSMNLLSIEIGGSKLQILAGNSGSEIHGRFRFTVNLELLQFGSEAGSLQSVNVVIGLL